MLKKDLIDIYKRHFPKYNQKDCLKIHYEYNKVNVNLFFDFYDSECIGFYLVLLYNDDCYFTPLNADNLDNNKKWFLEKIPTPILGNIKDENKKLDSFCNNLKEHIRDCIKNEQILKCNYGDSDFKKALKFTKKETDNKPFLYHIRYMNDKKMSPQQFYKLSNNFNIPIQTLQDLQKSNRTIITTSDISKRKTLIIILKESVF